MTDPTRPIVPVGDYYDCRGSERLEHESAEDAIEDYLETFMEPDCDVPAIIKERGSIELIAYDREELSEKWFESAAEDLFERVSETFADEFWSAADDTEPLELEMEKKTKELLPEMTALLKRFFAGVLVYNCTQVGKVELETEDVERMMREHRPDWFEAP